MDLFEQTLTLDEILSLALQAKQKFGQTKFEILATMEKLDEMETLVQSLRSDLLDKILETPR
jgi:hypothetical protein